MTSVSPEVVNSATFQVTAKAATVEAIHFESLRDRCLGDEEFFRTLVQNSLEQVSQHLSDMELAITAGSGRNLAQQAHAVSGIAANLSAHELRFWAAAVERAALGGNLQRTRPIAARVRAEFERCVAAVPQLLARFSEAR